MKDRSCKNEDLADSILDEKVELTDACGPREWRMDSDESAKEINTVIFEIIFWDYIDVCVYMV